LYHTKCSETGIWCIQLLKGLDPQCMAPHQESHNYGSIYVHVVYKLKFKVVSVQIVSDLQCSITFLHILYVHNYINCFVTYRRRQLI